jgi:hypothetical protein
MVSKHEAENLVGRLAALLRSFLDAHGRREAGVLFHPHSESMKAAQKALAEADAMTLSPRSIEDTATPPKATHK